ncbi:MerR family transcriptional regulator [Nocardia sp. NPDC050710]|uniref:MerR family transcriptional regulator n=1 Tax=Nocardia sp. NPDC050710 TaxID=3157220 RepID=UPI003406D96B
MDDDTLYPIGAAAERTGLTVKAVRFYADRGIVAPTTYSPTGYRLYDDAALARLALVRSLRELGLELPVIQRVLERRSALREVAAAHAAALDIQLRTLRVRRTVLRAVAERGSTPEEMELMHRLARLTADQRRSLIHDFVDDTFGTTDANPVLVELIRATVPELPDDPAPAQLAAWVELAELTQDPDFRASVRRMAEYQAAERANGDTTGLHHELTEAVLAAVGGAIEAGVAPDSAAAAPVVDALAARYAETFARADDADLREWMLTRLEVASDLRVERYWQLLSVIDGGEAPPSLAPVLSWFVSALRTRPVR